MEVKINIESNQMGDTVIDLFKSMSTEKKEELALSIMKEWLRSPEFFETNNKEQLVIDDFRKGKIKTYYGGEKYNEDTDEQIIRNDRNFREAMENYRTSKQVMVEDLKNEVINYYRKYIAEEIKGNEIIKRIKLETYTAIANEFPSIITQVLIQVFANNLTQMQNSIIETSMKTNFCRV